MTPSLADKTALERQKRELNLLEDRIKKRERQNKKLEKQLSERKNKLSKAERELRTNEADCKQQLESLNDTRKKADAKQLQLDTMINNQATKKNVFLPLSLIFFFVCLILGYLTFNYRQDYASASLALERAQTVKQQQDNSIDRLKREQSSLNSQLLQAGDQFRSQKKQLELEIKSQASRIAKSQDSLAGLKTDKNHEISGLQQKITAMETTITAAVEKLNIVASEKAAFSQKLAETEATLNQRQNELNSATTEMANAEQIILELSRRLESQTASVQTLSNRLTDTQNSRDSLLTSLNDQRNKVEALANNNQQLQENLANAQTLNQELSKNLQLLQDKLNSTAPIVSIPPEQTIKPAE